MWNSKPRSVVIPLLAAMLSSCGGDGPQQLPMLGLDDEPITLASGTTLGNSQWPQGSATAGGNGGPVGGVGCLVTENYHLHTHLSIFKDGQRLAIPRNVGLQGCAYELHTHDASGILHVETDIAKKFTLGQFFAVWGQPLTAGNVAGLTGASIEVFVVDGNVISKVDGNWADIELTAHRSINIVIGERPEKLPTYRWPATL